MLRDKNILILSPQGWIGQHISKHHYARTLAQRGNNVLFLAAPRIGMGLYYRTYKPIEGLPSLQVVDYSIPLPYTLSFHLPKLYQFLYQCRLRKIIKRYFRQIDVCIDFGHYRFFPDLKAIEATYKLYFPVDDFSNLTPDARGANICFSVSQNIVDKFNAGGIDCFFMQHGLSDVFVKHIPKRSKLESESQKVIRVGYAGNLMIRFLNRPLFRNIVEQFPDIEFHCFGNYKAESPLEADLSWQNWLTKQPNILLYGILDTETLAEKMQPMNAFWLCYQPDGKNYHAENSHKILEYLSTGKVIISTPISIYENTALLAMSTTEHFSSHFSSIINRLDYFNDLGKQKIRIEYALENTYDKQVDKIAKQIQINI